MSILYLPGEAANFVLTGTMTASSEDTNLDWDNLNNPQGWYAGRVSTAAADDYIHVDLGSSKAVTFCGVFFHNLDSGITVELRKGAAGETLVSTMTKQTPAFFSTFSSSSEQDWRLKFVGTNTNKIYIAKWILGVHTTLTPIQEYNWSLDYIMEQQQINNAIPGKNLTETARRALDLSFNPTSASDRDEILTMHRDSKWGQEPLIIVPDSNDTIVLYGRMNNAWSYRYPSGTHFPNKVRITEDPFPTIVN